MKGSVFGGILYLPKHPYADIHGLVRGVMRTKSATYVNNALEALGVQNCRALWSEHVWCESGSAVERLVTETHYGEMMVCPLVESYLNAGKYVPLGKEWFRQPQTA